jgi:membrane-associated phospholipid phosphatase
VSGNGILDASLRLTRRTASRTGAAAGAAAVFAAAPGSVLAQAPAGAPVEPRAGTWRTWLLTSGNQLLPAPPPDRAATEAELRELKALAGRRDAATLDRIKVWDAGPAPYRWTETLIEWAIPPDLRTGLAGGFLFRAFALVTAAMHDATIAAWDAKYAYNRPRPTEQDSSLTAAVAVPRSPSYPSEHAAAASAAAAVLGYLYPTDAEKFTGMALEAARSREEAGVQYPSDTAAGMDLGRKVAALAIERGQNDNSDATWDGTIPTGPGLWTGTNPVGVAEQYWKPWVLSSPDQLRPDPPPASDSEQKAAEMAELKDFARTPRTTGLSLMWNYGFYGNTVSVGNWVRQASQKLMEERMDADAPFATRLYSMISVGLNDIWIANQDGKYAYWAMRPFQLDPSFTTVFPTPNHPTYPSNRSALGMASDVLAHFFPRDAAAYQAMGEQVAESAVWAGIHFRSDLVAGRALGRAVGQILSDRIKNDA